MYAFQNHSQVFNSPSFQFIIPSASFMAQILGIFVPEFEDLSVILNGLQGLLGSGPQLLLQITFYLQGIIDLNPYNSPLQVRVFAISILPYDTIWYGNMQSQIQGPWPPQLGYPTWPILKISLLQDSLQNIDINEEILQNIDIDKILYW